MRYGSDFVPAEKLSPYIVTFSPHNYNSTQYTKPVKRPLLLSCGVVSKHYVINLFCIALNYYQKHRTILVYSLR
jgi:hypothetical protein